MNTTEGTSAAQAAPPRSSDDTVRAVLADYLAAHDMTPAQLAQLAGLKARSLQRKMLGRGSFLVTDVLMLADALGREPVELYA